ncbi:4-phosphoerythronate dehydrogenase PdxB [Halomonas sediminis]
MKIVVDANVPAAERCFGFFGEMLRLPGREITPADVRDADALIVRSVTPVNAALVANSTLSFVGTCTIGTDHIDLDALKARDIAFASAPGCNAEAVVDYVISSLLTLAERGGWQLGERCVGIVGVGNVGSRLRSRLQAMGVATLACDPPRAEKEGEDGYDSLATLLKRCDVICLHTPLVPDGRHATHHLLGAQELDRLAPGSIVLNAGRGDCIDGLALRQCLVGRGMAGRGLVGRDSISAVLDVWEHEPGIDAGLRDLAALATPHIAGYSLDGKLRGSWMIHAALAAKTGRTPLSLDALLPPPALAELSLAQALDAEDALRLCVRAVYDVRRDHDRLLCQMHEEGMTLGFDRCRVDYPLRREFSTLKVNLKGEALSLAPLLRAVGFQVNQQT